MSSDVWLRVAICSPLFFLSWGENLKTRLVNLWTPSHHKHHIRCIKSGVECVAWFGFAKELTWHFTTHVSDSVQIQSQSCLQSFLCKPELVWIMSATIGASLVSDMGTLTFENTYYKLAIHPICLVVESGDVWLDMSCAFELRWCLRALNKQAKSENGVWEIYEVSFTNFIWWTSVWAVKIWLVNITHWSWWVHTSGHDNTWHHLTHRFQNHHRLCQIQKLLEPFQITPHEHTPNLMYDWRVRCAGKSRLMSISAYLYLRLCMKPNAGTSGMRDMVLADCCDNSRPLGEGNLIGWFVSWIEL